MSKREIAAAAAKKYVLSLDNATANPPADRFHSVITLITLGKAEEGENINREKFLQAILTEFFIEYPVLAVPDAITDPQSVVVTVLDNVILTRLIGCGAAEHMSGGNKVRATLHDRMLGYQTVGTPTTPIKTQRPSPPHTAQRPTNNTPTITACLRRRHRGRCW